NRANGINQRGDIVGRCADINGPRSWVLPKGSTTPTLIDFSGAPFTPTNGSTTRAINDRGDIVGRYFDAGGVSHGYLLSHGVFNDVTFPGAVYTDARGINDPGVIVGFYRDLQLIPHGFIRDASGKFTEIRFPGADVTTARGINNSGDVVGAYAVINATVNPPTVAVHG